uniref:SH3 domain-containing protein n=1 Tax=Heterorhabditis bacteriophora TaxID=37862 RepID=A0A1I7WMK2_HETBA
MYIFLYIPHASLLILSDQWVFNRYDYDVLTMPNIMRRGVDVYQKLKHSSHSLFHVTTLYNAIARRSVESRLDDVTPSYNVEHLATFAVGRQFGLTFPADGIRKLKQMEKNSAIWAQPLILRFRQNSVTVEDENGDLVEQFPLDLIEQPTAHVSNDPRDTYNNMLLFAVREDTRNKRTATPTEMHIFQCNRVAATDVADDLQFYLRGQFRKVRNGRRSGGPSQTYYTSPPSMPQYPNDDASISSDSSELFERDVNTLNRCFDDIERFVARIQSSALAQRELEQQAHRYRTAQRRDKRAPPPPDPNGILHMRAQLPIEPEFIDILRKFKLSFNLLVRISILFDNLRSFSLCYQIIFIIKLYSREDWVGPLPAPYRPVFLDGFAPYGVPEQPSRSSFPTPLHRGESAPPVQYRQHPRDRSVDTLDLDRLSLEKERLDFERAKMIERERRLLEEEKQMSPPSPQTFSTPPRMVHSGRSMIMPDMADQSPRQRAFVEDVVSRGSKLVIATFDRVAQNPKELTTSRGEYLEVLDDSKNWWECRNVHQRVGYVPHTILSMVPVDHIDAPRDVYIPHGSRDNLHMNGHSQASPKQGMLPEDAPSYVKERQGKRGEFRYF